METLKDKKPGKMHSWSLNDYDGQNRIIYPATLFLIIEGERKVFHDISSLNIYIKQTKFKENVGSSISG